jgi:spore coat protein CotH
MINTNPVRKYFISYIILFYFPFWLFAQNINPGPDKIYRPNEIATIRMTMDEADKQALIFPDDPEANIYYNASVRFTNSAVDSTVYNVGIRIRGNTSRYHYKKSFKIDYKEFGGEKFFNYKKFNLKAENNDPSFLRELLSLYVYRTYNVPAARSHLCKVYINDEYMGAYLNIEQIDDEFVDRRFGTEAGNLYKCYYGASLENNNEIYNDWRYKLKTNELINDRSNLKKLVQTLNAISISNLNSALEPIFDIDSYMRQLAVETLLGHWDGYSYNVNNYYLYENPFTGQTVFIPYDVDNTFGIDWVDRDWGIRDVTDWSSHGKNLPLTQRLLKVDENFESYCRHMLTLQKEIFNLEHLEPIMDDLQAKFSDAVSDDAYFAVNGYTHNDYLNALDDAYGGHLEYGVKPYIEIRNQYASNQMDGLGFTPYDQTNAKEVLSNSIRLYPNPVKEQYFFLSIGMENAKIAVYDQLGRQIAMDYTALGNGEYRMIFSKEPVPGWYVLKVNDVAHRFIVY